jgi:signal peptidase II
LSRLQRLALVLVMLVICTGCDQISKVYARQRLSGAPSISLLFDTIRIQYMENHGATLGLGASLPENVRFVIFVVLIGLVLSAAFAYLMFSRDLSNGVMVGLSLVIAGGLGNLLDRILNHGAAIDFLNLGIGSLRTGVFNVADVVVYAGMAVFVYFSLKEPHKTED